MQSTVWRPSKAIVPSWARPRTPAAGGTRTGVDDARQAAVAEFSELASKFPQCVTIAAEWTQLAIPASPAPAAGNWLLYTMIDVDPWEQWGQDIVVFGVWMDMLSTDPTPTSGAAWGTDKGLGACVVIGDNQLPGATAGNFGTGVFPLVGIDSSVTNVTNSIGRRFFKRGFPTGKLSTGWIRRGMNGAFVPFVQRIAQRNRLRGLFVLNRTDALAAAGSSINGLVEVEVYAGLTRNTVDLAT